ncbi:MAG: Gfo/Idh/MocA family oxidoreductase [Planctomycetes bacterium]|nr:Gfo/Idh/MocA family oxidoreductase [Planctomycetota bacterium]
MTRRKMLHDTALAGAGAVILSSRGLYGAEKKSPNEKLNIAYVGSGGRGAANIAQLKDENVAALCDVDQVRAAATFEKYPDVRKFQDYRKMLDEMNKEIDAVVVSAPNHIHAPASAMAMRMGKHVYCEKPLTHSVYESRVLAQLAAEKKVATQMGTQMHASGNYRRAIEVLRSGAIGTARELDMWAAGGATHGEAPTPYSTKVGKGRPADTPPVPPTLNWDLWIGPAPMRPYHPCYLPREWHFWWDFGGGELGNVGCHYLDMPFWALDLRNPTAVEAEGDLLNPERTPARMTIKYEFAARGELPPLKFTWYWGRSSPRIKGQKVEEWPLCYLFVGDKGLMAVSPQKFVLLPEDKFADYKPPEKSIPDSIGHWAEWVAACRTGSPTGCHFGYSGPMTETVLLGNVAFRAGKKLDWDGPNLKVTNCPEAQQFVRREYRSAWTL